MLMMRGETGLQGGGLRREIPKVPPHLPPPEGCHHLHPTRANAAG